MNGDRLNRYRLLTLFLLVMVIAVSGATLWSRYGHTRSIEISLAPASELKGEVYVGGAVNSPGLYPLQSGDTINDILHAAGGPAGNADPGRVNLLVPEAGEAAQPQRIDINRASAWLLEALPGVGGTLAQRIVDYRQRNGPFKTTSDLLKVEGVGTAIYDRIKDHITVGE